MSMASNESPRDLPQKREAPSPRSRRAPDEGRRVSKEEYWAEWYESPYSNLDVSYEWNNGILEAIPPANYPQIRLYRWFFSLMYHYIQSHPIAELINLGVGVSMTVADASEPSGVWEVVYKPDIGVLLNGNPAPWGAVELRAVEGVCDMIVEAISDATLAEARRDTVEKRRGYALAGVKEYIILDPSDRYMRFYRLTEDGRYAEIQPGAEGVIVSEVLPGFQFRRSDLFKLPDFRELALDEVYAGYVMPGFREAVMRAERAEERFAVTRAARLQAEERAERAKERTERAKERIERAKERTEKAEERFAVTRAARLQAEEQIQALKAERSRLRQDRS